jgi:hypothetical protein
MAVAVARHLVKVDPGNPGAWINLAYSVWRAERIEQAEAILLKACVLHPPLSRLRPAIDLDKDIRRLALDGGQRVSSTACGRREGARVVAWTLNRRVRSNSAVNEGKHDARNNRLL